MRFGLMVCAVILILTGIRLVNIEKDIVTGVTVGFLAILCIWGSLVIEKIKDNKDTE